MRYPVSFAIFLAMIGVAAAQPGGDFVALNCFPGALGCGYLFGTDINGLTGEPQPMPTGPPPPDINDCAAICQGFDKTCEQTLLNMCDLNLVGVWQKPSGNSSIEAGSGLPDAYVPGKLLRKDPECHIEELCITTHATHGNCANVTGVADFKKAQTGISKHCRITSGAASQQMFVLPVVIGVAASFYKIFA